MYRPISSIRKRMILANHHIEEIANVFKKRPVNFGKHGGNKRIGVRRRKLGRR